MSCHDIGRGVDFIIQNVLDMYEHGEISKEAALKMIRTFPQVVNYCDGNESEALEYLTDNYCCGCLHEYGMRKPTTNRWKEAPPICAKYLIWLKTETLRKGV